MNLRDFVGSLARRWWVLVIGLALTAVAAVNVYQLVPVSYTASASVVLLPPKTLVGDVGNPFLYLGGLSQAVDVLVRKVAADEVSDPIERANPDSEFEIYSDTSSSGPIIVIFGQGPTKAATLDVVRDVLDATTPALQDMQTNLAVSPDSLITLDTLAVDKKPEIDQKNRLQAVLGVAGVGVVLTLLLAAVVDSLLLARRARRAAKAEQHDAEQNDPEQRSADQDDADQGTPAADPAPGSSDAGSSDAGSEPKANKARPSSARGSRTRLTGAVGSASKQRKPYR
ncbi:hypothetical protein [Conyzicola sp.]|uniref:hypothetical protein n=1 Tax=Conyzicola sp. TaxID=1969404 RepID=UPI00398A158C